MINYYKKSKKEFVKFIKLNPRCTKEEWDKYAQDNCFFSANTLMFHLLHNDLIKYLNKKNMNKFEYMKNMFLVVPVQHRDNKIFSTFLKINKINTKEKKVKENG